MNNDYIETIKEWVTIEDYPFKILILTSVLADANLAFRGTITDMCNWLQIGDSSKNRKAVKEGIEKLKEKELAFVEIIEKNTYVITILKKGLKDKRIINIRKQWIQALKDFNIPSNANVTRNWHTLLKTLICIFDLYKEKKENSILEDSGAIITMKNIATTIKVKEQTAGTLLKQLTQCELDDIFEIEKEVIKVKYKDNKGQDKIKTIGTRIELNNQFEK